MLLTSVTQKGLIFLTRLHDGLSHLREPKLKHSFLAILNHICLIRVLNLQKFQFPSSLDLSSLYYFIFITCFVRFLVSSRYTKFLLYLFIVIFYVLYVCFCMYCLCRIKKRQFLPSKTFNQQITSNHYFKILCLLSTLLFSFSGFPLLRRCLLLAS